MKTLSERLLAKIRVTDAGCWEFTGFRLPNGYGRISRGGRPELAHRVSWEEARGPIPVGLCVLHRCDNRPCVNPAHLFLGTHKDNMDDMLAKHRKVAARSQPTKQGDRHHFAKLTRQQVAAIIARKDEGCRSLAQEFGVSRHHIGRLIRGERWKHVDLFARERTA